MTDTDVEVDLLAPFAVVDVAAVAATHGVSAEVVREGLAAHQRLARRHRDVDGLVFEYRVEFREQPVLARGDGAYYLAVPPRVWPEFAARLDVGEAVVAAVKAVHERAATDHRDGGAIGAIGVDSDGVPATDGDREAMVLTRS